MQIHVVRSGESLYSIAQTFDVLVADLASANQIDPQDSLVIGQALVIPITGRYYFVQPGDSLYVIGSMFRISASVLAQVNEIDMMRHLQIGQRLYIPPMPKAKIQTNAYADTNIYGGFSKETLASVAEESPLLTYAAPFSFQAKADGSLEMIDVSPVKTASAGSGVVLMMVVTNLENGRFSNTLGEAILNSVSVQNILLNNIVQTAIKTGFRDVHFDFEYLRPEDRENYNAFLWKASSRLHGEGLMMSTALAPKTSASQTGVWYSAHDYRAHGEAADFVVIMTYEWGYSGGPPMPVSPIGPVRKVLEYAKTEIPADKIMMGQNLYGYDWTLPYVQGGEYARALSPQDAIALARSRGADINYDYKAQAPFFSYYDYDGPPTEHIVWFEDARSISAKFELLKELGLRGISYWKLGLSFPQNWLLLGDRFIIAKR